MPESQPRAGSRPGSAISTSGFDSGQSGSESDVDSVRRQLEETESRFRTMADTAPVLLWMAGMDGLCDFFNQGWLNFTGRSMAEELGNGWAEGVHAEDFAPAMQIFFDAFVARKAFSMEYRLRRHDGEYRWIFDQGAPRFDGGGVFVGFIGSCVDVTAQRQASDALGRLNQVLEERVRERTQLASEREMLLREVHHRVKNDLQLVSSLLSMQGREFADSKTEQAFEECQDRVQVIAQIHESMYQSDNLAQLSFSEHLRTVTAHVGRGSGPGNSITLALDLGENVALRVDRAIPCGMIVHELVSNAFKHAFPAGRRGTVTLSCRKHSAGSISVVVADDGVGMPEAPQRRPGLGWTLIEAFARQLEGTLRVAADGGTRIELCFAEPQHSGAENSATRATRAGRRESRMEAEG
jgi:two-component system, sensor histidine kinase PdtaS